MDPSIIVSGRDLEIQSRSLSSLLQLTVWRSQTEKVMEAMHRKGLSLDTQTGRVREGAGLVSMAIAPGRWLIETADDSILGLAPGIGVVTDLTHARVSFAFSGGRAPDLACKITPVDLDLPRHGPGSVIQAGSAHSIPFTSWRRARDSFVLYVDASYARDFAHGLAAEAEEFLNPL